MSIFVIFKMCILFFFVERLRATSRGLAGHRLGISDLGLLFTLGTVCYTYRPAASIRSPFIFTLYSDNAPLPMN